MRTLFIILIFITTYAKAQVKISFNGFSCSEETADGSGSDEIYFIMNIFKGGVYQQTIKFPQKSYIGGVDAGGNYLLGSETLYEGPAKDIAVVIYGFEWDKSDPDAVRTKVEGFMKEKGKRKYEELVMDSVKGYYVIHPAEELKSSRYDWVENRTLHAGDDGIGARALVFPRSVTKYPLALKEAYSKIKPPNKINYPYNVAVDISALDGKGKFTCYFSIDATYPEIDDLPIRYFWNANEWIGKPIKMALKNKADTKFIAFFENANVYSSTKGTFEVHGDILKEYSKNNGGNMLFLGYPLSNEIDIKTSGNYAFLEWAKAGYLKYNRFENGYILWRPNHTSTISNAEFSAGPKTPIGSINNINAVKKDLPIVSNNIDAMIFQKGLDANLGKVHSESPVPRPTAGAGGKFLRFERGWVYYNPKTKTAHVVNGEIMVKWGSLGYETGQMGFPTSDELDDNNYVGYQRVSKFDKGSIYYGVNKPVMVVMGQSNSKIK